MSSRTRQDELVRILRRRGSSTIEYLSESLGFSRRTLLRDIAALRDQGFVIETSSGPGGGIYLDPTSVLLTPKLSGSEVFALLISMKVLQQTHSFPFANLADAGLGKIEKSLPRDRVRELRQILASVYIGQPASEEVMSTLKSIDPSVLPAFEAGFLNSQRLRFGYIDRNGRKTRREADVHALLVLSPVWYLVGLDPQKDAFRHFRMDRMSRVRVLDERFSRRSFKLYDGDSSISVLGSA